LRRIFQPIDQIKIGKKGKRKKGKKRRILPCLSDASLIDDCAKDGKKLAPCPWQDERRTGRKFSKPDYLFD